MSNDKVLTDKVFKVQIYGDTWHVYLVTDEDHHILDDGDYAEADFEKKELYFRKTTLQIIRHELIHALTYYTFTDTADLTALQNEELMAELMSWNWDKITELSLYIYKGLETLKQLKDE